MEQSKIPVASAIMSRPVITLRTEMRIIDAMRTLLKKNISGAPVLDQEGVLVGMVSEFDCLRMVASGLYGQEDLGDSEPLRGLMSTEVWTIAPNTDVFTVTQLLVDKRIRRVPVLDGKEIVGIVSRRDILSSVHQLRRDQIQALKRRGDKGLYLSAQEGASNPFAD